ncbi:MAG TPA: hypothetical protein VHG51_11840 [Longimicrobiaceae bacterium]|nr:hypothetical protein [Longimicrobiaceae bacterium]
MRRLTGKLFQGVFGALVVGALGFGASQAFAEGAAAALPGCNLIECRAACTARYGEGTQAACVRTTTAQYVCQCYP